MLYEVITLPIETFPELPSPGAVESRLAGWCKKVYSRNPEARITSYNVCYTKLLRGLKLLLHGDKQIMQKLYRKNHNLLIF